MSREKQGFRDTLERLDKAFPDRELLTITDVAQFTGVKRETVRKWIVLNPATRRVSKVDLARQVCV